PARFTRAQCVCSRGRGGDIGAGLGEHVHHAGVVVETHLLGRLDLESSHVTDVHFLVGIHDGASGGVVNDQAEGVGGESQLAVDEQRVAPGDLFPVRPSPVTGLVPDHAQVHVAVTDVVGHEVRPVDI